MSVVRTPARTPMLRTLLVRHLTPRVHDGRHHVVRRGICTCTQRVLRECVVHPHRCCAPFLCAASHHTCLTPGTRGRERHLHLRTARAQKCVVHPRRCCAPFFLRRLTPRVLDARHAWSGEASAPAHSACSEKMPCTHTGAAHPVHRLTPRVHDGGHAWS